MAEARFARLAREPLFDELVPSSNPAVGLVKAARIRFAPGQPSGLHRHPISTCGVVTQGSFRFQVEGKESKTLGVGDAFFEPAQVTILAFDNASDSDSAEIVCFYLTDTSDRPPIEMLGHGMDQQLGKE